MTTHTSTSLHTSTLKGSGHLLPSMMVGEVLDGRYELVSIVGEGAMGVVFRARQLSVNRDVAVKLIKADQLEEVGLNRRFKLEMEIISSLQHPNIVKLLDTGKDVRLGVYFLVMEYIEGCALGQVLYEPLDPVRLHPILALEIGSQICSALTEPHRLGVIHRDIKPDNILLTVRSDEQLDIKLLDFGVARIVQPHERIETSHTHRLTATGGIVGTPPYMAPEICDATHLISAQSDLYAVGALLFELLTGAPPFPGRSTAEVLYKHAHEPAPRLFDISPLPECPSPELERLLDAMLAKNPADRPESALHVKRAIDGIRQQFHLSRPQLSYQDGATSPERFAPYLLHTVSLAEVSSEPMTQTLERELIEAMNAAEGVYETPQPRRLDTLPPPPARATIPPRRPPSMPGLATDATAEVARPDLAQWDELEAEEFDKKPSKFKYILGAIVALVALSALVALARREEEPAPPAPSITAPQSASPQQDAPTLQEPTLVPTITAARDTLFQARATALDTLPLPAPMPPLEKIEKRQVRTTPPPVDKTDTPASSSTSASETTTPPRKDPVPTPNEQDAPLKKNLDWLYKK